MIKIIKTSEKAIIPKKATQDSAGYDIYSIEQSCKLLSLERKSFSTGIKIQIPRGYFGRISPRSGLSLKSGIDVMAGTIDSDYTGEIKIILINLSEIEVQIDTNKAIAQLIIQKHYDMDLLLSDKFEKTERGESGFGSTDKINPADYGYLNKVG